MQISERLVLALVEWTEAKQQYLNQPLGRAKLSELLAARRRVDEADSALYVAAIMEKQLIPPPRGPAR